MGSARSDDESEPPQTIGWMLILVVGGMIALSILKSNSASVEEKQTPGPARGDMVLQDSDLPEELAKWSKSARLSVTPPEDLPDWQYWWTHTWNYKNETASALVALDQADWVYWHELTVCYESNGWTLDDRVVVVDQTSADWPFVIANLTNPDGRRALIVFSMFTGEGQSACPPDYFVNSDEQEQSLADRFSQRLNHETNVLPERLLQCQVLLAYRDTLTDELRSEATALHLASRDRFMELCRQHAIHQHNRVDTQKAD